MKKHLVAMCAMALCLTLTVPAMAYTPFGPDGKPTDDWKRRDHDLNLEQYKMKPDKPVGPGVNSDFSVGNQMTITNYYINGNTYVVDYSYISTTKLFCSDDALIRIEGPYGIAVCPIPVGYKALSYDIDSEKHTIYVKVEKNPIYIGDKSEIGKLRPANYYTLGMECSLKQFRLGDEARVL